MMSCLVRWVILVGIIAISVADALAATIDLTPPSSRPSVCSGQQGSWESNTYVCAWGKPFVAAPGDVIIANQDIQIQSHSGFHISHVRFGGNGYRIDLTASGSNQIKLSQSEVFGSILGPANVIFDAKTKIHGNINVNGTVSIDDAVIDGNITSLNNNVTLSNTSVGGAISAKGNITLRDSQVEGLVKTESNKVEAIRATLNSGAYGHSGIFITDSQVTGDLGTNCNNLYIRSTTMHTGVIKTTPVLGQGCSAHEVKIVDSDVTANIIGGGNNVIIENSTFQGDIQARYNVRLKESVIYGHIIGEVNFDLHLTELYNTYIYGSVTVGEEAWQKIIGNWPDSAIYGECVYGQVLPPELCEPIPPQMAPVLKLSYPPVALACNEIPVLIEAFDNNGNPLSNQTLTVDLTPGNIWQGNSTVTFTGQTTLALKRQVGSYQLGVSASNPSISNIICSSSDCRLDIVESGFVLNVPNLVAGVPDIGTIQALRTDGLGELCIPAFSDTSKEVLFTTDYINPSSGTISPFVNTSELSQGLTTILLDFDEDAKAQITIRYDDVGLIALRASYNGSGTETGLQMKGTGSLVSRPHTLSVIEAFESTSSTANPATTTSGEGFIAAGQPFSVIIESKNAHGNLTPNFGKESPRQKVQVSTEESDIKLVYPEGGNTGSLTSGENNTTSPGIGRQQVDNIRWSEVGSIQLQAKLLGNDYLGAGDVLHRPFSSTIGRFFPHNFVLDFVKAEHGCGSFTYMNQPFNISYQLVAMNALGQQVKNYDSSLYIGTAKIGGVAQETMGVDQSARLNFPISSWNYGVYEVFGTNNTEFMRNSSVSPDGPLSVQLGIRILPGTEIDGRNLATINLGSDGVRLGDPQNIYFGRLQIENMGGPEDNDLPIMLNTEYWNGISFVPNILDNCTLVSPDKIYPQPLIMETRASESIVIQVASDPNFSTVSAGRSIGPGIWLTAPGVPGNGVLEYHPPSWLKYNWSGEATNFDENPQAEFSFGQYRGNDRIIYWRHGL